MAKAKPAAQEKPELTVVKNSEIEIDEKRLAEVFADLKGHQGDISTATGQLRATLKAYLSDTGLHKGAIGMIRAIDNMGETSQADFLRSFRPLMELMMKSRWKKSQADMLDVLSVKEE